MSVDSNSPGGDSSCSVCSTSEKDQSLLGFEYQCIDDVVALGGGVLNLNWSGHSQHSMKALHDMYLSGQLCDVEIQCASQKIACHRSVLAASSAYFMGMFTSNMQEAKSDVIDLKGLNPDGVKALIDFAYTGQLQVNRGNVEDLMQSASFLTVQPVIEACGGYLRRMLDTSNCAAFIALADIHGSHVLRRRAEFFCLQNFDAVSKTSEFVKLPLHIVERLLANDLLRVKCEEDVYAVIIKWCQNDAIGNVAGDCGTEPGREVNVSEHRYDALPRLLETLRWGLLEPRFLVEVVQRNTHITTEARCMSMVAMEKDHRLTSGCQAMSDSARPRSWDKLRACYMGSLYVAGGRGGDRQVSALLPWRYVERYDFCRDEWVSVNSMKKSRRHVAVCTAGPGLLYAVGGHDGVNHLSSVEVYDPVADRWAELAPIRVARRGHALVAAGPAGPLYAIGGINNGGSIFVVERYNIQTNTWQDIASMGQERGGCGAAAMGVHIYVAGGNSATQSSTNTMEAYDLLHDTWAQRAPMKSKRAGFGMTVLKDKIIVAGGFDDEEPLRAVEVYQPQTDTWSSLAPMTVPRGGVSIAAMSGFVFAVGGHDGKSYLSSVEVLGDLPCQLSAVQKRDDPEETLITEEELEPETTISASRASSDSSVDGPEQEASSGDALSGVWRVVESMLYQRAGPGVAVLPTVPSGPYAFPNHLQGPLALSAANGNDTAQ